MALNINNIPDFKKPLLMELTLENLENSDISRKTKIPWACEPYIE